MSIPIFGKTAPSGSIKQVENKEPKDYIINFKITDRQMKTAEKDFTKTTDRVFWTEEVEANQALSDVNALLGATFVLSKSFPASRYDIECISIKEKLIKVPKFIV